MAASKHLALPVPVLFVLTDLRVGGQERKVVEIVRRIDRAKIRPLIATLKEPGALAAEAEAAGVPVHSRLIHGKYDLLVLWRLARLMRREGIQVVCTVGTGDCMFWGRLAGCLARVRGIVSTIHATRNPAGGRVLERPNRWLTPCTGAFVGVARAASEYLVKEEGLPRRKVVTIYNGVDLRRYHGQGRDAARRALELEDGAVVIVHLAAFRPEKAHDLLLRAMRRVADAAPHARLLLVGDGPLRPQIEAQSRELGLERAVRLLGQRSDIPEILAAADVLTLPSHDRVETFPNSVLEAMASRRPAVCTRVGSVHEMLEDGVTGYLVAPGDEAALAERLLRLVRDPELRAAMGERARAAVEQRFSAERMVGDREDLFLALARGEPPPERLY